MPADTKRIPTNIVTGFLGVGKTTAILQLLKHKPENEVWGVLVNEFGQVGIDGAILSAEGCVVKEVPGGCLCCAAGLPMKIGLNMLISKAKPDRILIEPTGLGHLENVIADLTGEFYRDVLALNATLCLVDPRQLLSDKYQSNQNFQDQLSLADVVVANKTEALTSADQAQFERFFDRFEPIKAALTWTTQGKLSTELLALPLNRARKAQHLAQHLQHQHKHSADDEESVFSEDPRFIRKVGRGQGLVSSGWIFDPQQVFDLMPVATVLDGLCVTRLKAALITTSGNFVINSVNGDCQFDAIDELKESRIEIISDQALDWDQIEIRLCESLVEQEQ